MALVFPKLFSALSVEAEVGELDECMSCVVSEVLNTSYELALDYPVNGRYASQLSVGAFIVCKPNPYSSADWFHIHRVSKATSRIISVNAEHVTYASNHMVCRPFKDYAEEAGQAYTITNYLNDEASINPSPITIGFSAETFQHPHIWSVSSHTEIKDVMSMASKLFGGEWEFVGTSATLVNHRGQDRGVELTNATNLISLSADNDISDVYTHIFPFWTGTNENGDTETVYASPSAFVQVSMYSTRFRPYIYDCSNQFASKPTSDEVYIKASEFASENFAALGAAVSSFSVEVVQRGKTIEGAHLTDADHIEIGDVIHINVPDIDVVTTQRVTAVKYNVLQDRLTTVTLGTSRPSVTDIISKAKKEDEKEKLEKSKTDTAKEDKEEKDKEEIPTKVIKVSDNEVEAQYGDTIVVWTADGSGNERYNFRKKVYAAEPEPDPDEGGEDEDITPNE